jgi:hypothetical protein
MSNPGPNITSTSNLISENIPQSDGHQYGASASALQGFYGATPITQPTAAAQAAITDSSGGSANPTTGVAALTGTYNSTIIANALATVIAQTNAMRTALVNLGLMKGS